MYSFLVPLIQLSTDVSQVFTPCQSMSVVSNMNIIELQQKNLTGVECGKGCKSKLFIVESDLLKEQYLPCY